MHISALFPAEAVLRDVPRAVDLFKKSGQDARKTGRPGSLPDKNFVEHRRILQPWRVDASNFNDAVLIVLGHGTVENDNSAAPVRQHAAELRRRKIFRDVREAFWKQEPQIKDVLAGISAPRIFIVPLFISEGYFAGQVIPRELGFGEHPIRLRSEATARQASSPPSQCDGAGGIQPAFAMLWRGGHSTLLYCHPVGTHDSMTDVILARADEVVKKFPFPRTPKSSETTLFLAGHGTEKDANSRKSIERQVELVRAKQIYADVRAIYLEESPRIPDCYLLAQTKNIIIVPFFISDGLHTQEDIPVLLGETKKNVEQRLAAGQPTWRNPTEKNGKLVWYSPAVGSAPELAGVILERVGEAIENL